MNDSPGHDAGDQLLINVAKRLQECTREGDTIAWPGGDEFTIIMEDVNSIDDAVKIADKVLHLIAQMDMEAKLRRVIERQEFVLYYQPKFSVDSKAPIGAEALIRTLR